ncbi:MAG: glycosyltransferase family 39 protein [Clostridia bacterium]|nr:glycosyltransferase family 39 protein [Clostridia bacterium]
MRKILIAMLAMLLVLMPAFSSYAQTPEATEPAEALGTAEAEYEELIRNGSFDFDGLAFWSKEAWHDEYTASIVDYEDGAVAYLSAPAQENDVRFYQQVKTEPNSVYMLTCRVKTENVANGNGANISVVDTYAFSTPVTGTNDWQEVQLVGRTGEEQTSMVVCVRLGGYGATSTGEAWFDDFSVRKIENTEGLSVLDFSPFTLTQNEDTTTENTEESGSSLYIYLIAAFVVAVVAALIIMQSINKKKGNSKAVAQEVNISEKNTKKAGVTPLKPILDDPEDTRLNFSKKDWIACIALTVVYAVVAIFNLGTTSAPQTYKVIEFGEETVLNFDKEVQFSSIWMFTGIDEGTILVSDENGSNMTYQIENGAMYRWKKLDNAASLNGKTLKIEVTEGKAWINEMAFFDVNGERVMPVSISEGAEALIDEADTVPEHPSYYNGMYFDELYHARTAYEHLNGMYPYEWTHPPLGKLFISIGIAIFGMSAFGWRIAGTVFGIIMVPIMYCFGKRVFKKWEFAFITAAIFAFDFMHFAQTRIATIDVYGVFFIILMYYYMYQYYRMNFFTHGLKKTLKPLGIAGLFFGFGIASKWIGFYAGGGLAVVLLASFIKRYKEAKKLAASKSKADRELAKTYWNNVSQTVMWCCLFYIIVPFLIYFLAFIPYYKYYGCLDGDISIFAKLGKCFERFITEQERMFSYHSGLDATHSYASPWYQWPVIARPVWYYIGYYPGTETASTISGMGNPAVWWISSIGALTMICKMAVNSFRKWLNGKEGIMELDKVYEEKSEVDARVVFVIAIAANFLPWMLITRCTFQYHFFATVPFIILLTVALFKQIEDKYPKFKYAKWIWLALAVALFAVFYPVISGYPAPIKYIDALQWLPSWSFRGY